MPVQKIQRHLQNIYELEVAHDIKDFLVTDSELARKLRGGPAHRETPEQLLMQQRGDCLELSLYLEGELLNRLENDNPYHTLHNDNLADFCTALEGISHFLYVVWNATHNRPVSVLELELQAEVDKFVTTMELLTRQCGEVPNHDLHFALFRAVSYAPELSDREKRRYWWANQYASRYCLHLQRHYLHPSRTAHLANELRRFYRLTNKEKIRRIETPVFR